MLTNNIVSFEQPGPGHLLAHIVMTNENNAENKKSESMPEIIFSGSN